jgi:hypothetical protein
MFFLIPFGFVLSVLMSAAALTIGSAIPPAAFLFMMLAF